MGVWSLPIMTLEFQHSSLISTSLSKSSKSPVSSLSIPSSSSSTIAIFSEGINPKKVGDCQFDTPTPLVFPKMCFLEREREREREREKEREREILFAFYFQYYPKPSISCKFHCNS